jgi:tetratricopeptide (TPR) repeat protein
VSHFDKALASNAGYAPALSGKGDALLAQGKSDAALQAFRAALSADPSLTGLTNRVAALQFRGEQQQVAAARKAADAGQFDQARRGYQAAIAASPQSAFLYRELAIVDGKAGDRASALIHAQQAVQLDPTDVTALTLIAETYEADHDWAHAIEAYSAVNAADPSEATAAKIEDLRSTAAFESMPQEYRAIAETPAVTRGQLAALIGIRLGDVLRRVRPAAVPVVTDTRGNWAATWIVAVTRAGVMEVFPNHTFQPSAAVRRADLAAAASRLLSVIAADNPRLAARWRDPRPKFSDLAPTHLSYPAAARAVSAGIMTPFPDGSFQLARPVSGADAIDAVTKLAALAKK